MTTKNQLDELKRRFINASDKEREEIDKEIAAAIDHAPEAVATITLAQIKETNERAEADLIRSRLKNILPAISLAYVAKTYFGKSRQWLCQRINGNLVNGKPARFTPAELRTLDAALKDLAARLSEIRVF